MINSFRLPDLVLGVSIRADVTGARQAARTLKNAIGRELGTGGGTTGGGGGGGFGGGLLGGLFGAGMMGGGKGGQTSGLPMSLSGAYIGKIRSKIKSSAQAIATTVGTASAGIYNAAKTVRGPRKRIMSGGLLDSPLGMFVYNEGLTDTVKMMSKGQRQVRRLFGKASVGKLKQHGVNIHPAMLNMMGLTNYGTTSTLGTGSAGGYWASSLAGGTGAIAGGGAGAAGTAAGLGKAGRLSPRMFSRMGKTAGLGGLGGLGATMMMVGRFLGPLGFALIGAALAFKMAMSFVVSSLATATNWIRKMGITAGAFGNYTAQLDNFTVVWRNLKLEFGLMLIKVFDLGSLFQSMIPVIVLLSQLVKEIVETPKAQGFMKGFLLSVAPWATPEGWNALGEFIGATNPVGAPWGATGRSVPTTGPLAGISNSVNMSPAALQGSMEASRIINQSIMSDTTQTARNTKLCADTLQQILNRSPELLAIHG